jgi:hypothetical protein
MPSSPSMRQRCITSCASANDLLVPEFILAIRPGCCKRLPLFAYVRICRLHARLVPGIFWLGAGYERERAGKASDARYAITAFHRTAFADIGGAAAVLANKRRGTVTVFKESSTNLAQACP